MHNSASQTNPTTQKSPWFKWMILILLLGVLFTPLLRSAPTRVTAQQENGYWIDVQTIAAADFGVSLVTGLAYSPAARALVVMDENAQPTIISKLGDLLASYELALPEVDPTNLVFSESSGRLYLMDNAGQGLVEVEAGFDASLPGSQRAVNTHSINQFGIRNPQGMSIDPSSGRMYILDAGGPAIIGIPPDEAGSYGSAASENRIERIQLQSLRGLSLRGLAFNPETGWLYVYSGDENKIYGLNQDGKIQTTLDLAGLWLTDLQGMVFADSTDSTDSPQQMNLFLADSGETLSDSATTTSSVIELSLTVVGPLAVPPGSNPTTLVNIIDSSLWSPPNPDSAGVEFNMVTGRLLVSDSEVEEMPPYWAGMNIFSATNTGTLVSTCSTTAFSTEPTGTAVNPANGHVFISDDNKRRVFEVNLGPDNTYCTADDIVTSISTLAFNDDDPEGVAYGGGNLFVTDGVGMEVNVVSPGNNGVFDGVPPDGDDTYTHFDTSAMGLRDPEGIGYHWDRGTLFIISRTDDFVVEATTGGAVLNNYDITASNIYSPAGAAIGPGSQNPAVMNLYIADRGVDNNQDPNENDGKIYEINFGGGVSPTLSPTNMPGPSATPTNTPTFPASAMVTSQVNVSSDDAEEEINTGISDITSSDLELGADAGVLQWVGMRFNNIAIPAGATITNAYVEFEVDETGTAATVVTFFGQASVNASTFSTAQFNISSRPRTTAQAVWNIPSWSVVDAKWQTPDLSGIISEIVNQPGWLAGNSIVIMANGTGRRTAESVNGEIPAAPKLVISYATGPAPTATNTPLPPTATDTPLPPTATDTPLPPMATDTPLPPTATDTPGPSPTPTDTPLPPTATDTPLPPTATNTPLPPTATPTDTAVPPTATFTPIATLPPPAAPIYLSLQNTGPTIVGAVTDASYDDILYYDGVNWSKLFDGSDLGLSSPIDAFAIVNSSTVLISLTKTADVASVGRVYPQDILQFSATSLGENTAGTFSVYFDGSDVGLERSTENITSLFRLPDGRLIVSTKGAASVPGLTTAMEDLLIFTPTSLGPFTAGSWALYFDGSDVSLAGGTRVDAVAVAANGDLLLSSWGTFALSTVSGDNEDVFVCTPVSLGDVTTCTFSPTLYFDGSLYGLAGDNVDGISLP